MLLDIGNIVIIVLLKNGQHSKDIHLHDFRVQNTKYAVAVYYRLVSKN